MFQPVEGPLSARGEEWREIHYYAYVERPFDELWPLLATQPNNVLGDGRAVPRGRGTSELHAHFGGVDVARNVAMQFSELIREDERARLEMQCRAARHPRMFPLLEATLELAPLPSGRRHFTQVGLVGRYSRRSVSLAMWPTVSGEAGSRSSPSATSWRAWPNAWRPWSLRTGPSPTRTSPPPTPLENPPAPD
jgi:hypothetical protein